MYEERSSREEIMPKKKKGGCRKKPIYEHEFSLFSRETIKRILEFRVARTNWIKTQDLLHKFTHKSVEEEINESNYYQGRCMCLRKLRLRTTNLRTHYRTLRPLRCYTLRKKLSFLEAEGKKDDLKLQSPPSETVTRRKGFKLPKTQSVKIRNVKFRHRGDDYAETVYSVTVDENSPEKYKIIDEDIQKGKQNLKSVDEIEASEKDKSTGKFKKKKEKKSKKGAVEAPVEVVENTNGTTLHPILKSDSGLRKYKKSSKTKTQARKKNRWLLRRDPNKRAMENLKKNKNSPKIVKPCRCDDGKEVTLVIKGFCLCKKLNLNRLKAGKVCKHSNKTQTEDYIEPHVTDSLQIHRKRINSKSEEESKKVPSEPSIFPEEEPNVAQNKQEEAKVNNVDKQEEEKPERRRVFEDVTLETNDDFEKHDNFSKTENFESPVEEEKSENIIEKEKNEKTVEKEKNEKIVEKEKNEKVVEKEKSEKVVEKEKSEKVEKEKSGKIVDRERSYKRESKSKDNDSLVVLYENKIRKKSVLGLTKEQYEKIKRFK